MAFHGVIPITNVNGTARTEAAIDGDEAEVFREENVELIFFSEVIFFLDPLVKLDPVGRLVTGFDHAALKFLGPVREIDELVTAHAGVGGDAGGFGVLLWIRRIGRVKGTRKDGMTRDVVAPFGKGNAPWIGVRVGTECG